MEITESLIMDKIDKEKLLQSYLMKRSKLVASYADKLYPNCYANFYKSTPDIDYKKEIAFIQHQIHLLR
jgi:hypothetical protein